MIKVETGDVVIANVKVKEKDKKFLMTVTDVSDSSLTGVYLKNSEKTNMVLELSNVIANLGSKPAPGWVYGVGIAELHDVHVLTDGRKIIERYSPVPQANLDAVTKMLNRFPKIFDLLGFQIEMHGAKGNTMGSYATSKQQGSKKDVMALHPMAFKNEKELSHTMVHEAGHGVWNRLMSRPLKTEIIQHYLNAIRVFPTDIPVMRDLAKRFDESEDHIWKFLTTLVKAEKPVFKRMVTWTKAVHKVGWEELNDLHLGKASIMGYIPTHELIQSNAIPVVTQYGTKNVQEFFCEAFALHHIGEKLPKEISATLTLVSEELGL